MHQAYLIYKESKWNKCREKKREQTEGRRSQLISQQLCYKEAVWQWQGAASLLFQHLQQIGYYQKLDFSCQVILILIWSWGDSRFLKEQIKDASGNVFPA